MTLRSIAIAAALFALGFGAGAWWMDARLAPQIAELEAAAEQSLIADLAKLAVDTPGPQLPSAAATVAAALAPSVAAPAPVAPAARTSTLAEPPASWMSIEQQRAAALAYRESVRESNRQAWERVAGLDAELFLIEGQDPAWGATMESKVRASMADHDSFRDIALQSLECRVTVCRASLFIKDVDSPQALPNGGRALWYAWRGAQIIPNRAEINDGVPGFRFTVYLGENFEQSRIAPAPRRRGPGGP